MNHLCFLLNLFILNFIHHLFYHCNYETSIPRNYNTRFCLFRKNWESHNTLGERNTPQLLMIRNMAYVTFSNIYL